MQRRLIYYTLQLRKIVLASRGRVACAPSLSLSFSLSRAIDPFKSGQYYYVRVCVLCTHPTYILHILFIYIYLLSLSIIRGLSHGRPAPPMGNIIDRIL